MATSPRSRTTNGTNRLHGLAARRSGRLERGDERLVLVGTRRLRLHPTRIIRDAPDPPPVPSLDRWTVNWPPRARLTPEERERGLRAVAELRRLHAEIMAEREGRPFPVSATDLLHEAREERTRQLERVFSKPRQASID